LAVRTQAAQAEDRRKPKTGEKVEVPQKFLSSKPSKELKDW